MSRNNKPSYRAQIKKGGLYGAGAGILLICLYAFFKKTVQKPEELKKRYEPDLYRQYSRGAKEASEAERSEMDKDERRSHAPGI